MKKNNKKILMITQMYPTGLTGTSVKTRHTIEFLSEQGFQVDVCCLHHSSMVLNDLTLPGVRVFFSERDIISKLSPDYILRAISVLFSTLPFRVKKTFDKKLSAIFEVLQLSTLYDYVFFDGFSTLQYCKEYSDKHIYIDDEDISDLMQRRMKDEKNMLLKFFYFTEFIKCKNFEKKYLPRVSQVWAISPNSADHLKKSTSAKMTVMPTVLPKRKNIFSVQAKDIVFTGLLSWQENINAVKWFLDNHWQTILQAFPRTNFYVIGQRANQEFIDYLNTFRNVKYLGYVENLEDIYKKSALAIAPLLINCGIKVKVITYLSYGLPVVALPEAVWGMQENKGVVISKNQDFAQQIISLLKNTNQRKDLSKQARENIEKNHSWKTEEKFFKQVGLL